MRIAVSGAHRTGKSTLVDDLRRKLQGYLAIDEPYRLLEEEGHVFGQPPSLDDFELQLDRSIRAIRESPSDVLFDRCPADLLAYLATHRDRDAFDLAAWLSRVQEAMERIDRIILIPIEAPDRIARSDDARPRWRRAVDTEIRSILLDDPWNFGVATFEVRGTREERLAAALRHLGLD